MKLPQPQFLTDNSGKKLSVVFSMKEYQHIVEDLEELEDIRLYDTVKAKNEKGISFDEYLAQRKRNKNA